MSEPLLLDTDVIIDYLRGQTDAVAYLEGLTNPLLISAVTVAELYVGVREGEEREALDIL
ncbi:PIN domain-containing protein [Romeria aff. gracilis LEGE 07310]|uniref:PIN domain-containing protein n=2 Tax=Vasconcelosia TaxID=3366328 RepID=A0A8J7DLL9_9CYAN|nr:PIN domain-containing protein [Romeria aff. gracilis LEGE 07310]